MWRLLLLSLTFCQHPNVGLENQTLKSCPDSPNCVSSMDNRASHHILPLDVPSQIDQPIQILAEIIQTMGASIEVSNPSYCHAIFISRLLRFRDDFEALFDAKSRKIHLRSASRLGYSDLGVNRKRVEKVRSLWNQKHNIL